MQALISGLQKHFPNGSFTLGNVPYTTAALVTLFTSLANAIAAADAAKASAKEAVAAMRAARVNVGPVMKDLQDFLLATFRTASGTLADFGLEPKAPRTLTAEEKAASAAKAKSTRDARGIVGKRKRASVKGDVTGVVMTPVTEAPAPQPPASPAKSQ
ncbi:MAG TPA: hypothetical protein VF765_33010 [Polyangiaceae bacterium]